jgi:hypothetical protein
VGRKFATLEVIDAANVPRFEGSSMVTEGGATTVIGCADALPVVLQRVTGKLSIGVALQLMVGPAPAYPDKSTMMRSSEGRGVKVAVGDPIRIELGTP